MVPRIEICGNIASGKTTLARNFANCGLTAVEERYLSNPFIESFYTNPAYFSFEAEITFLLQHYHAIKTTHHNGTLVCDYSLTLDKAYADVTLAENRQQIFFNIVNELEAEIGQPSQIIYLKCPEEVLLRRIRKRNRSFEASIDIKYLQALSKAIATRMNSVAKIVDVLEINTHEINYVSGIDDIDALSSICSR